MKEPRHTITLPSQLTARLADLVDAGEFTNLDDAVATAVRRYLEHRDYLQAQGGIRSASVG